MEPQLFTPGPYKAGEQVKDTAGNTWQAKRDMLKSTVLSSTYWTNLSDASAVQAPAPAVGFSFVSGLSESGDNYAVLQAAIDAKKGGKIYLPAGTFFCSNPLTWKDKTLQLIGEGMGVTVLAFRGTSGLVVTRSHSQLKSLIADLSVISYGEKTKGKHGLDISAVCDVRDVYVKNFGGNGVRYTGNLGTGTDVSGSACYGVQVAECGEDGFFVEGGDANALNFFGCDARDNGGTGFMDRSFLGCNWWGCMGHNNARGNFGVDQYNNNGRTVIAGPYDEGGSPKSVISVYTTIIGGTWGSGFKVTARDDAEEKHGTYLPLEGNQTYVIPSFFKK